MTKDGDDSRTSAKGLWKDGEAMLDAAVVLIQWAGSNDREQMRLSMPTYFLLGHGIEVTLKSVLRAHGSSLEELRRDLGHNLERAANRVVKLNIDPLSRFVAINVRLVKMLNPYYSAKAFEYRDTGSMFPPPTEKLAEFLSQLLKMAEPRPKRSASRQPA
jgi:hypothetical protein